MESENDVSVTTSVDKRGLLPGQRFVRVDYSDPLAAPLLEDLVYEYDARYGDVPGHDAHSEVFRYPAEAFAAPVGGFILLLEDEVPISGGAFMRFDEATAEFKRIWTHRDHRGRGLAGVLLAELEREAAALGYTHVYLTTGPRQPEAVRLYDKNGYTAQFDRDAPPEQIGAHAFTKRLG